MTLTFTEYAARARATATYRGRGTELGLAYAALKLCGEAGEYLDNPRDLRELGDCWWMTVALCDELAFPFNGIAARLHGSHGSTYSAGEGAYEVVDQALVIAEIVGKSIGSPDGVTPERRDALRREVESLVDRLHCCVDEIGTTFEEVAALNVAKLAARQEAGTLLGGDRSGES